MGHFRVIESEIESETAELIEALREAIEPIAPVGTVSYAIMLFDPTGITTAAQIIEKGFYWEAIKAKLIERNQLDQIKDSRVDWKTTRDE